MLSTYAAEKGVLPSARGCIGPELFYESNPCYIGGSTYTWHSAFNAAMAEYIQGTPTAASGRVSGSGITASGLFYDNSSGTSGYIGFPIFGDSSCPSIAGATLYGQTAMGQEVYCRIRTPAVT